MNKTKIIQILFFTIILGFNCYSLDKIDKPDNLEYSGKHIESTNYATNITNPEQNSDIFGSSKISKPDSVSGIKKTVSIDPLDAIIIYQNVYKTALKDKKISMEERVFLKTLQRIMLIPKTTILSIQNQIHSIIPKQLDQSGRWPLVLQNIGWGAGLYGWAIPYVLGADDYKWIVGTEMMSFAGAFYLTHKYTKKMEIPHSRAQMMRAGSGIGFHYGWAINDLFDIWGGEEKASLVVLMSSIPVGIIAGDYIFNKLNPTNGQAWSLTLWSSISLHTVTQLHQIIDPKPEEPDYWDIQNQPEKDEVHERKKWEKDEKNWKKRRAIGSLISYPIGIYVGNKYFGEKSYTFGDALMLFQGFGLGWLYSTMTADILDLKFTKPGGRLSRIGGTIGGTLLFDRYINNYDYTFGQSFLMFLGTGSGMAFDMGLAAILEVDDPTVIELLIMGGGVAGFFLTKSILTIEKENQYSNSKSPVISISPTFFINPEYSRRLTKSIIPGININITF